MKQRCQARLSEEFSGGGRLKQREGRRKDGPPVAGTSPARVLAVLVVPSSRLRAACQCCSAAPSAFKLQQPGLHDAAVCAAAGRVEALVRYVRWVNRDRVETYSAILVAN